MQSVSMKKTDEYIKNILKIWNSVLFLADQCSGSFAI